MCLQPCIQSDKDCHFLKKIIKMFLKTYLGIKNFSRIALKNILTNVVEFILKESSDAKFTLQVI